MSHILIDTEAEDAVVGLMMALRTAQESPCTRGRCGTAIYRPRTRAGSYNDLFVSTGYNTPPGGSPPRCDLKHELGPGFKSDRTCCIHAEQRAIMAALRQDKAQGARLYFARVGQDNQLTPSGAPYCTICSKMALDAGIAEWVLYQGEDIRLYGAAEYNDLSFAYGKAP